MTSKIAMGAFTVFAQQCFGYMNTLPSVTNVPAAPMLRVVESLISCKGPFSGLTACAVCTCSAVSPRL